jgi:hypothetical protein
MKNSVLGLTFVSAVMASSIALANPPHGDDHPGDGRPGPSTHRESVPEIPAKGLGAGLLLLAGGAAVILGRRRKAS